MLERAVILAATLAVAGPATQPLHAQVQIGTDPDAPYTLHGIGPDHDMISQSFMIPVGVSLYTFLTIAVWIDPSMALTQWTNLYFSFWNNAIDFDDVQQVNTTQPDWYRFTFSNVPVTAGAIFFFALAGDYSLDYYERCTDLIFDEPTDPACPASVGQFFTRRTTVDAYPFGNADDRSDTSGDVVFSVRFHNGDAHTIPEPMTMVLLATGLAGVGAAARRRKRGDAL